MRLVSLTLLAALGVPPTSASNDGGGAPAEKLRTFTALTGPLPLFPGEVTNTWHRLAIPPGPIAISEFAADVVEKDPRTGAIVPVPLSEAYLHHHVAYSEHGAGSSNGNADGDGDGRRKLSILGHSMGPMAPAKTSVSRGVAFGAGTESRGTRQKFPYPFRFATAEGEDHLVANVHVINTRTMTTRQARRCLECPCTAQDHAFEDGVATSALSDAVLDRKRGGWDGCNDALVEEGNDSCFPDRYRGGLYCCEHGEFCLDDYFMTEDELSRADNGTRSVFYLRYNLTYAPPTPEVRHLGLAACCDATGDETRSGNVEYDIPKCADDDDLCVHELETVQTLHGATGGAFVGPHDEGDAYVDVVYMVGHLHRGGESVSAYLADGMPLCVSLPTYGTGAPGEIGNEPGYVNRMSSCAFDPPLRMKTTDEIRVVGRYGAKVARTGVMSLFYIAIADSADPAQESHGSRKRFRSFLVSFAFGLGCCAVGYHVGAKYHRRRSYEPVPNNENGLSHPYLSGVVGSPGI